MADLDPEVCAQVYVDWEYRKIWDNYVLGQCSHYPCVLYRISQFCLSNWLRRVKQSVPSFYLSATKSIRKLLKHAIWLIPGGVWTTILVFLISCLTCAQCRRLPPLCIFSQKNLTSITPGESVFFIHRFFWMLCSRQIRLLAENYQRIGVLVIVTLTTRCVHRLWTAQMTLYFVHTSHPDLHPIKDETTGLDGLYWCVDYPWPMWDRDVSMDTMVKLYIIGCKRIANVLLFTVALLIK